MADSNRVPRFELHIRPMMRLLDRDQMVAAKGLDLWDYDRVREEADKIIDHIAVDMPPVAHGGLWPAEWLSLFRRWVDAGFPRLEVGAADLAGYQISVSGTRVTLAAQGTFPTGGYSAWLDPQVIEGGQREFTLYWEPPAAAQSPSPTPYRTRFRYIPSVIPAAMLVHDAAGRHEIPFQPSPSLALAGNAAPAVAAALQSRGGTLLARTAADAGEHFLFDVAGTAVHVSTDPLSTDVEGPAELLHDLGQHDTIRAVIASQSR